jgi:hypothetical protein
MDNYKHIVLQFDQAQQPKFREVKSKNYVEFGEHNDYPNYLLNLYNESAKHGAIIKGKAGYIYGKGFEEVGNANSKGESWNAVLKKCIKDDEIYRGYYLQVIWNRAKQVSEVYHIEFSKVRVSADLQKFYVKNNWSDNREKMREYDAFNINNPYGSQIFYYKEYNPSSEIYPVASYQQALNYIECDIMVSRHLLGLANQSFTGTTLVNLNNGDPINEEHKGEVERGLLQKFTGDKGKRVVIMFNKSRENAAEILPLGTTTLTKEDFTNVNNLITQEIFAAHQCVSPTLFGIQTTGSLGSRNEIREAYEIFNNTYVSERQAEFETVFNKFISLKTGVKTELKIEPVQPLKFEFSEAIMAANLTQDEIRELMGKEPLQVGTVTSNGTVANNIPAIKPIAAESNDAIKNLTGRQYQNVMRIVRQFSTGKLNKEQATLMLKNGFGFSDADVNTFLGVDDNPTTEEFASQEDSFIMEFESCGDDASQYEVISKKPEREVNYFAEIKTLNQSQADVLDLITKDAKITPDVIGETLGLEKKLVERIISDLIDSSIIESKVTKIGNDAIIERNVLKPVSELGGKNSKSSTIYIRYTYEGPEDDRNRPFCKRMLELSKTKMWSRSDIEQISMRLGYSVWDRRGGWYTLPNTNEHRPYCRHDWISNIVTKKK